MSKATNHAALVDKVLKIPIVAAKVRAKKVLRVCQNPRCYRLYEDYCTPESVPYCTACYGRINNFAQMSGAYVPSVPIEHAPDGALKEIIRQLKGRK